MRTSQWGAQTGWHRYEHGGGGGPRRRGNKKWLPFAALALLLVVGGVAYTKFDPAAFNSAIGNANAVSGKPGASSDPAKGRDTQWGPVTAMDEDMIKKVMTANFWEGEMGVQAAERGTTPEVRQAGQVMAEDHNGSLRDATVGIAAKLKVPLPKRATEAQRKIMERLDRSEGREFDLVFVNSLRNAHGVIYPALANMYASTKNTQVRSYTGAGLAVVFKHIGLLNATGLVDDKLLDDPSQSNVAKPLDANDGGVGADESDAQIPSGSDAGSSESGSDSSSNSEDSDSDSSSGSEDSDSNSSNESSNSDDADSAGSGGSAGGADSTDLDPASSEQGASQASTGFVPGGDLGVVAILAILGVAVLGNFLVFRSRRKGARAR